MARVSPFCAKKIDEKIGAWYDDYISIGIFKIGLNRGCVFDKLSELDSFCRKQQLSLKHWQTYTKIKLEEYNDAYKLSLANKILKYAL